MSNEKKQEKKIEGLTIKNFMFQDSNGNMSFLSRDKAEEILLDTMDKRSRETVLNIYDAFIEQLKKATRSELLLAKKTKVLHNNLTNCLIELEN